MKSFIGKLLLFSTPILLVVLFIIIIDPYNFLNISHIINDKDKIKVLNRSNASEPRGNVIWKTIAFKRRPVENLLIGDSQGKYFDTALIRRITGEGYFNYNVPGGSYKTMFSLFWFATDYIKLKNVYFQCGFMNYNDYRDYNLINYGIELMNNPLSYFSNINFLEDTYYNALYALTKNEDIVRIYYLNMSPKELDSLAYYRAKGFFKKYKYPENYYFELKKITDYCKENGISFHFVITPNYIGLEKYLKEFGLTEARDRFKSDLKSLAPTIDMEYLEGISDDRSKFYDYFHCRREYVDLIVEMIWGNRKIERLIKSKADEEQN